MRVRLASGLREILEVIITPKLPLLVP